MGGVVPHGTANGYVNYKCRCQACRQANTERLRPILSARRRELADFIDGYLAEHPCVDCGEDDVVVLEFDHVRGQKAFGVGETSALLPNLDKLTIEIAKCEVRCGNCHRRITVARRLATPKPVSTRKDPAQDPRRMPRWRYRERRQSEIRNTISEHLARECCKDCGEKDIEVLEFDHVRGRKAFAISRAVTSIPSQARLLNEIAKCEVRCVNCHRRITSRRRMSLLAN